jgi:hypothetical protein
MMSSETYDVWLLEFAGSAEPVASLRQAFDIDAERASRIVSTLPRVVKHGVSAAEAEEVAAALRALGATVEIRAARPDPKRSGADLARPPRKAPAAEPVTPPSLEPTPEESAPVGDPKLDFDAPLDIAPRSATSSRSGMPRPKLAPAEDGAAPTPAAATAGSAKTSAPGRARAAAPGGTAAASLDPLDPFAAGGAALELAVEAPREKPKPVKRTAVDAESLARIEQQRAPEVEPPKPRPRFTVPPRVWRAALVIGAALLALYGLRSLGRELARPDAPVAVPAVSDEERTLSTALEMDAFLAQDGARFGLEASRNRDLANEVRSAGATRVLAGDIVEMDDRRVATTLVVELPSSPARRRRIAAAIEAYRRRTAVDPETVEVPAPEERRVFVEMQ